MGRGTLSDGHCLSAFQGRLINFEKRRKVSSHSLHLAMEVRGLPPTPGVEIRGLPPAPGSTLAPSPSWYINGGRWVHRGGYLSQWRVRQEVRIGDSLLGRDCLSPAPRIG